jgi:hypothetical protein
MKIRILISCFLLLFLLSFLSISVVIASWNGPIEVFSAQWGNAAGQLGHKSGNGLEYFPISILITDDNKILIGDIVNDRVVIFNHTGIYYKAFRPSALPADSHLASRLQWTTLKGARFLLKLGGKYQIYNTEGVLLNQFEGTSDHIREIISLPDNSIIVHKDKPTSYYHYQSDGTLLKTDTAEPQEIVTIHEQRRRIVQSLDIPGSNENIQIGSPVVAPNGDVYIWKKTEIKYTVMKWTRVAAGE